MRTAWILRAFAATALIGCNSDDAGAEDDNTDTMVSASATGATSPTSSVTTSNDESSTTSMDDSGDTSTGEPADACGPDRACLGPPPLGWTGPITLVKGDSNDPEALPTCGGKWPEEEGVRFEGWNTPPDAECGCSCEVSAGAGCYAYINTSSPEQPEECFWNYQDAYEGCNTLTTPVTDGLITAQSDPEFGATCTPDSTETIAPIPWDALVRSCSGTYTDQACDSTDRICYDKPAKGFEQQICYVAEGEIPCPPNTDYLERTVRYAEFIDERDCTQCQCGQIASCASEYDYYETDDCSGAPAGTIDDGVCITATVASVNFDFSGISCPVTSEAEPEGDAKPTKPWTYCCSEPF